jgi:hypothetical protein
MCPSRSSGPLQAARGTRVRDARFAVDLHCPDTAGRLCHLQVRLCSKTLHDRGHQFSSAVCQKRPCSKQRAYSMVLGASTILGNRIVKVDP